MASQFVPDNAPTAVFDDVRQALSELLATADTEAFTERDLIDTLRAFEDTKAALAAAQATLTVRLDHTVRDRHAAARVSAAHQGRDVAGLIGYARRESPAKGSRLLGLAQALTELPHTLAALHAGALSEWRATLIARETACLSAATGPRIDATPCQRTRPDGTYPFDGWGDRRLVAETQRRVYAVDPRAVVNRRRRAEADRHVSCVPPPTPCPSSPRCSPPPRASPSGPP